MFLRHRRRSPLSTVLSAKMWLDSADTRCGTSICTWEAQSTVPSTLVDLSPTPGQDSVSIFADLLLTGGWPGRHPGRITAWKLALTECTLRPPRTPSQDRPTVLRIGR